MSITGLPELDALIKGVNKKAGRELITNTVYESHGVISTGSVTLDCALKVDGVPEGRIIEVLGEPGGGKTSLCMSILAKAQQRRLLKDPESRKRDLVIDLEKTITGEFMRGFGVNTDLVVQVRPSTADEALQIARDLPRSGLIDIVLFDSVGAAQSERQAQRNIGDVDVGGISKLMHEALRNIVGTADETKTTYLFINHVTMNPGVRMGDPRTSPGGRALPYYSSVRLLLMTGKPHPTVPGAMQMRVQVKKNKMAPPFGNDPISFAFTYGVGVDPVNEIMDLLHTAGRLRNSAGQTKIKVSEDAEWEAIDPEMEKGKVGCYSYLSENEDAVNRLQDIYRSL